MQLYIKSSCTDLCRPVCYYNIQVTVDKTLKQCALSILQSELYTVSYLAMQFRIVLLSLLAIFSSEVQYAMGTPRNPTPQCDPGEENDCSRCFDVLVNQVVVNDRNRYNLQRAFFPPNVANPVFVEVTYYFTRNASGNGSTDYSNTSISEVWYWTESTFYLIQPIQSLQFTSLLFSDISLRRETLVLYLQPDCYQENDTERDLRMQLFTQRVCKI